MKKSKVLYLLPLFGLLLGGCDFEFNPEDPVGSVKDFFVGEVWQPVKEFFTGNKEVEPQKEEQKQDEQQHQSGQQDSGQESGGNQSGEQTEVTVKSIAVKENSVKIAFYVNDKFSVEGGKLVVSYSDNSTKEVDMTLDMIPVKPDMTKPNENLKVDVSYLDKTTSYYIKVVEAPAPTVAEIAVKTSPKVDYFVGDEFTVDGGVLQVTMSDSTRKNVNMTLDMIDNAPDMSVVHEDYEVLVTYEGAHTSYVVNVRAKEAVLISVSYNYDDQGETAIIDFDEELQFVEGKEYSFVFSATPSDAQDYLETKYLTRGDNPTELNAKPSDAGEYTFTVELNAEGDKLYEHSSKSVDFKISEAPPKSAYTIENDEYEIAFFEQYNDVANCISTEDYSYGNDRPLGVDSIGGHLYGTYGNSGSKLKQTNYETNLMGGVNEDLKWRFSGLNVKGKNNPNRLYIQLENNSSNWNICNSSSFPEETSPDEYALGQIVTAAGKAKGASLVSTTVIKNIRDLSFYWRSSYATTAFICYQLENETEWKVLHKMSMNESDEKIHGNYTGTHGWDTFGYTTFNSETWTSKELYGANAKIAFVCTEAPTESGSLPLSAITINSDKAAVRYLNALTYKEGITTTNSMYDLHLGQADKRHNQDLFHLATNHVSGSFLKGYELQGSETEIKNAKDFYNSLVTEIPELGDAK